jgi:hypothetical protein
MKTIRTDLGITDINKTAKIYQNKCYNIFGDAKESNPEAIPSF